MVSLLAGGLIFSTLGFTGIASTAAESADHVQTATQADLQLDDFQPVSATSGWIHLGGRLYWTADTGGHWRDITPSLPAAARVLSVAFLDSQNGRVLWTEPQASGDLSLSISFTNDGGLTWESRPVELLAASDLDASIESAGMDWLDENTGWVALRRQTGSNFSAGTLFHTVDGGQTWQRSPLPVGGTIRFVDDQAGWLAGGPAEDQLFKTVDAGQTWEAAALPSDPTSPLERLYTPVFDLKGNGLLAAIVTVDQEHHLRFYTTDDGGGSWTLAADFPLGAETMVAPLTLLDPRTAIATVPGSNQILRFRQGQPDTLTSTDGLSAGIVDLKMLSLETGWAEWNESTCTKAASGQDGLTDITCTSSTKLLLTDDGGLTWTALHLPGVEAGTLLQTSTTPSGNPFPLRAATPSPNTQIFIGKGFDICGVAPLSTLDIWDDYSPYASMNIYIGGSMRAHGCNFSGLNAAYLVTARDIGFTFIPTWVGPQAPCTNYLNRISSDVGQAYAEGINEANAALDALALLGLTTPDKKGSIVYYDMEAFPNNTDQGCREAVKSFMNGWDYQLKLSNTASGIYGSTGCYNGLNNYLQIAYPPDAMWAALWDDHDTVWNIGCIPNTAWPNHQRIHQYAGAHNESYANDKGQVGTLNIDSNAMDGIVAVPNPPIVTPPPSAAFTATPLSGNAPLVVHFHITSTANILTCAWDYGDGQTGTTCADHTHTYTQTGSFSVKLTVQGPGGTDDSTRANYISVTEPSHPDLVPFPRGSNVDPVIISSVPNTTQNDTLYVNQPIFIDWGFKNIGNASISTSFKAEMYIDDQRIIDYVIPGLGAQATGGYGDTSVTWDSAGWHTVRLVIDPENAVVESNEENNVWEGQFFWETTPAVGPTTYGPTGIIYDSTPDFTWSKLNNPDIIYYEIYISSLSPNPNWLVFSQYIYLDHCSASMCTYTSNAILPAGDYQFRIGARDKYGLIAYSPWQIFSESGLPAAPTNLSPTGSLADQTPTFSWSKSAAASWYELQVIPNGSTTPVIVETSIQALSSCAGNLCIWTPIKYLDKGAYTFRVRAANLSGVSAYIEAAFSQTADVYRINLPMIIR